MFAWSKYQLAVFAAIKDTNRSVIIEAVAGASKTTSIVHAAKLLPMSQSVLFLAFNVSIVNELKSRLPEHITCSTLNSLGFRSWRNYVGRRTLKVDASKTAGILRQALSEEDFKFYAPFVIKMVSLAKSAGLGGFLMEDTLENWEALREHHNVKLGTEKEEGFDTDYSRAIELCQKALNRSSSMANSLVDFDDQIYMPYLRGARFDQYHVVFVDELQDVSPVQRSLLKRVIKSGGRIIGVGDSYQSIYGFRGADHNSMEDFAKEFDCLRLPLSISYRCSKAIVREAQKYVPQIEPFESAPEGLVETIPDYIATQFLKTDVVLCRNTAPLVKMAYGLIGRGSGVNMPGRDFAKGLQKLVKDLKATDFADLSEKLELWLQHQTEVLTAKKKESKIEYVRDRVDTIDIIMSNLPADKTTIKDLLEEIQFVFQGRDEAVTMMTIHKAKGQEWDRVFILDFHLMPSKYAKGHPWMEIQERNLIYVAITRAKNYLGYIVSNEFSDKDEEARRASRESFIANRMKSERPVAVRKTKKKDIGPLRIKINIK